MPFRALPNVDFHDPNLRFVDLTGDGMADILITEDDAFTWYASLGRPVSPRRNERYRHLTRSVDHDSFSRIASNRSISLICRATG